MCVVSSSSLRLLVYLCIFACIFLMVAIVVNEARVDNKKGKAAAVQNRGHEKSERIYITFVTLKPLILFSHFHTKKIIRENVLHASCKLMKQVAHVNKQSKH